jgi:hypothetical protein
MSVAGLVICRVHITEIVMVIMVTNYTPITCYCSTSNLIVPFTGDASSMNSLLLALIFGVYCSHGK